MRMLLVEDNRNLAETVLARLRGEGHAIDVEHDGTVADELLRHARFDLVILDIGLPGVSGFDILRNLRERGDDAAVLILTARSQIDDRLSGLDAGADDFLVKPFDFRELVARIRVLMRRRAGLAQDEFRSGRLVFDRRARRAAIDGRDVGLRNREVQLMEVFIGNLGRVLTKEEIADRLYTYDETPSLNAVEQLVARLRRRIDGSGITIKSMRGLGYLVDAE